MNKQKTFHASIDSLHPMLGFIREALAEMAFDKSIAAHVELALEEALVNIIQYAYAKHPGDIEIQITAASEREITFILKDRGPFFNPLEIEGAPIDPSLPLEEIEEGGLGIFFMKQYMDRITYQRDEPYNVLTLTKKSL